MFSKILFVDIQEMDRLVEEIKIRLNTMGIDVVVGPNVEPLNEYQKALLLRVVIFGAFYPNYFARPAITGKIDEREAVKTVCGLDPYSTVRLHKFPINEPPMAYVRQIKSNMSDIFRKFPTLSNEYKRLLIVYSLLPRNAQRGSMERQGNVRRPARLRPVSPGR